MRKDLVEITTICPDVENSQFVVQSNCPETIPEILKSQSVAANGNSTSYQQCSLPRIKILGTGGTIASKAVDSSQTADYHVDLTIQDLLDAIPDISKVCDIEYEQLCNVDSKDIDQDILYKIYKGISESLQTFDGIVITHGTDTLSETAFFIESTVDAGDVPIVFVGSMRPSTSISADGPMNLYQAICIASNPKSRGRSVLVSLNDQISSGYYITKTNANSLDSFNVRQGYLGNFVNNEIHYYYPPVKPQGCHKFKLRIIGDTFKLPEVCILYAHQAFPPSIVNLVADKYDGIVLATMGAGSLPEEVNRTCLKLNLPIVYSKRSMDGMVPIANVRKNGSNGHNVIASGYLSPEKSRILLQLCLAGNYSMEEVKHVFTGVYGG
ncbi:asp1p [Saccharomyces arboricola H-6]|uniref:asparaginase n=1 Tax=Saccharomyces arboricola (strain H-6 / AS 2.3317 / CBS 10644) TaxID=1160507 RepID=J8PY57_SACAR|nr:asp1p [Saccharomyces arboricola H-6]